MTVISEWPLPVLNLNPWNVPFIFSLLTSWEEESQSSFGGHLTSHQVKPHPWKTSKTFPSIAVLEQNSIFRENKIYWAVSSSSNKRLFSEEKTVHLSFVPPGDKSWEFFLMANTQSRLRFDLLEPNYNDWRKGVGLICFCVLPLNMKGLQHLV